jgi:GxxExxY protein
MGKKLKYKGEKTSVRLQDFYKRKAGHQFESLSQKIIGAAIRVHKELGPGFLESIYEEALKIELSKQGYKYETQKQIIIKYHDNEVGTHRLDLLVEGLIIVELKAVKELTDSHFAQLRSYLKATGLKIGLLVNFAKPTLEIKRVVN